MPHEPVVTPRLIVTKDEDDIGAFRICDTEVNSDSSVRR